MQRRMEWPIRDRYPFSLRIRTLMAILAQLRL